MKNRDLIIYGKNTNEIYDTFIEVIPSWYLPNDTISIYHVQSSNLVIRKNQTPLSPKACLVRLITEDENYSNIIKYLKEITQCEVKQI